MFLGASPLNLDAKGRMAIPAKYRAALAADEVARVVVTINPRARCLTLYPEADWQEIADKVSRLPAMNPRNVHLQRLLLGNASEQELDGQGRIALSPTLRQHAGLNKKVVLIGQNYKFEIWDEETWHTSSQQWVTEFQQGKASTSEPIDEIVF